nr:tetraspanin-3-like [Aedes albopictus]
MDSRTPLFLDRASGGLQEATPPPYIGHFHQSPTSTKSVNTLGSLMTGCTLPRRRGLDKKRKEQICGGAQLVIGAFLLWTHRQYSAIVNDQFWEPFVVIIALGLVAQLICYFGWTSTSKKHRCYLGTFCAFLVILIVIQFLISGWAVATKQQLLTPAELAIETSFGQFVATAGAITDPTHIWNRLQRDLQCCGINNVHDYKKEKQKQLGLPWSCYNPVDSKIYDVGCAHVLVKSIEMDIIKWPSLR